MMDKKYLFRCLIVVHKDNQAIINTQLEAKGYGPNNFTLRVTKATSPTVLIGYVSGWPCSFNMIRDLKFLADTYKLSEIVLWPRTDIKQVPQKMRAKIVAVFNKPEYQVASPTARTKARVTLRANPVTLAATLTYLGLVRM